MAIWIRGAALALFLLAGTQAWAKTAPAVPPLPAGTAASIHTYTQLALSPSGQQVASLDSTSDENATTPPHAVITVRATSNGEVLRTLDPCPTCRYAGPSWSPLGDALAFIASDRKLGTASLMVAQGGQVRTVATLKGIAGHPRWSPDGKVIAMLATENARKEAGATQAGAPMTGEIGEQEDEQRIATVSVSGGSMRFVSPTGNYVYEYDWTPDGSGFVATSAKGNGDNNWWIARLYAVDARAGTMREIAAPPTQIALPQVSPDGKTVAYVGGLMSDFGVFSGDLYTVPFAGGTPVNATPDYKGSFTSVQWKDDMIVGSALILDHAAITSVKPATGEVKVLWTGDISVSGGASVASIKTNGTVFAFVAQDYAHAPALTAGTIDRLQPITHDNDKFTADVAVRSVTWNNDGLTVQGWLVEPRANAGSQQRNPMIVIAHGGPAYMSMPTYAGPGVPRTLLDAGYTLFMPNPRGSAGQGEAFKRGNVRDFGGGDLRDILTGIDKVLTVAPVDANRLGIMGHSYGGCMVMWAVTQTDRFKAAAAGAGVSNWISYYGQNGINQWMIPFFGASAYDDPAAYRAASPLEKIKNAKTPTLLTVGERDIEVPAPQSLEFWNGLRAMNVPAKLVIYEGEGHNFRQPAHLRDLRQQTLAWFDKYLQAASAGAASDTPAAVPVR
jgi:dipeptidyl aminopeptidase/acylaminoacyl peptidase